MSFAHALGSRLKKEAGIKDYFSWAVPKAQETSTPPASRFQAGRQALLGNPAYNLVTGGVHNQPLPSKMSAPPASRLQAGRQALLGNPAYNLVTGSAYTQPRPRAREVPTPTSPETSTPASPETPTPELAWHGRRLVDATPEQLSSARHNDLQELFTHIMPGAYQRDPETDEIIREGGVPQGRRHTGWAAATDPETGEILRAGVLPGEGSDFMELGTVPSYQPIQNISSDEVSELRDKGHQFEPANLAAQMKSKGISQPSQTAGLARGMGRALAAQPLTGQGVPPGLPRAMGIPLSAQPYYGQQPSAYDYYGPAGQVPSPQRQISGTLPGMTAPQAPATQYAGQQPEASDGGLWGFIRDAGSRARNALGF